MILQEYISFHVGPRVFLLAVPLISYMTLSNSFNSSGLQCCKIRNLEEMVSKVPSSSNILWNANRWQHNMGILSQLLKDWNCVWLIRIFIAALGCSVLANFSPEKVTVKVSFLTQADRCLYINYLLKVDINYLFKTQIYCYAKENFF